MGTSYISVKWPGRGWKLVALLIWKWALVNQVGSAREDETFRQWVSCMRLLRSYSTWIATGKRKANRNDGLGQVGNKAKASLHGATWFHVNSYSLLKVLLCIFVKQLYFELSMIFPRARIGHKSPGLLRFSSVSVRSPAGPGGSSRAISPGLLGTCPFSQWCEILWVYGVAWLEGL